MAEKIICKKYKYVFPMFVFVSLIFRVGKESETENLTQRQSGSGEGLEGRVINVVKTSKIHYTLRPDRGTIK